MSEYRTEDERIAEGAALLDAVRPGWVDLINLDDLDLGEPGYCILGQVFGGYGAGLDILAPELPTEPTRAELLARDVWAIDHGFEVNAMIATYRVYDRMTRRWTRLIESRRRAALN